MNHLSHHDLAWTLRLLPKIVLAALKERPGKVFLAGGFIRSAVAREAVNDIDLFVPDKETASVLASALAEFDPKRIWKTDNAFTIKGHKIPIQIIHRWLFDTPESCAESFDFTIAMTVIYWKADPLNPEEGCWVGLCHPDFYADLAAKRLVYTSPVRNEEAGGSLLRVLKFYQRGYRIPLSSMGAVIARLLSGVDEVNFEKRATMGKLDWEKQMGALFTGLLKEVDPAIDPNHLAHLPDPKPREETPADVQTP